MARRIGEVELGLYAHRDYIARRGTPTSMEDLVAHLLIGFDRETAFIRGLRTRGIGLRREMFALRTDSDLAHLAAIRMGCGIGVCQAGLARRDWRLVRVLREAFSLRLEMWLAMHEDHRTSCRCSITFDALAAGLGDYISSTSPANTGLSIT